MLMSIGSPLAGWQPKTKSYFEIPNILADSVCFSSHLNALPAPCCALQGLLWALEISSSCCCSMYPAITAKPPNSSSNGLPQ